MGKGKGGGDKRRRLERERAARAAAAARAKHTPKPPPAALPVTEASVALAAALTEAGLTELAERARRLEYDENYSRHDLPLRKLVEDLLHEQQPGLIDRVTAGDFDATDADEAAWAATPAGRAEHAEMQALDAAMPAELREQLLQGLRALGEDPKTQERIVKGHVAQMQAEIDAPVDPAQVNRQLHVLLGTRGPNGERLDTQEILAAAEAAGRCGAQGWELGWTYDDQPTERSGWYVRTRVKGQTFGTHQQHTSPHAAVQALLRQLLHGSMCTGCQRVITLDAEGIMAHDATLLDGRPWSAAQQAAAGCCHWRREGLHWVKGCP